MFTAFLNVGPHTKIDANGTVVNLVSHGVGVLCLRVWVKVEVLVVECEREPHKIIQDA